MDGWRRCISEPSPGGRAQMEISITRDFPCRSTIKGLSLSLLLSLSRTQHGWTIKSSTAFCIPPAIARSIDPSLHLIIQRALHYPNYPRSVLPSSISSIRSDVLSGFSYRIFLLICRYLQIYDNICSDFFRFHKSLRNTGICHMIQLKLLSHLLLHLPF